MRPARGGKSSAFTRPMIFAAPRRLGLYPIPISRRLTVPVLARLAHFIVRRRKLVIGVWMALTLFGAFSAGQVSKRWFESFSIPGYSAYEANQRTLKTFGTGEQSPLVAVFRSQGDVTKATGVEKAIAAAAAINPGSRVSSYFSTHEPLVRLEGRAHDVRGDLPAREPRLQLVRAHRRGARGADARRRPPASKAYLTGRDPIYDALVGRRHAGRAS